ncbi:MAG: RNA methyltransferase [Gemmatimonadota bacterium]
MSSALETTIRDLHRRKARERRGFTLAEGVRLVEEAVESGVQILGAVVSPNLESGERGRQLVAALERRDVLIERVGDESLVKLADTEHPQGVIAVVHSPNWSVADLQRNDQRVVVVLDAVQDPGNVGAILRTALGLGAAGVVALPGTAELTNPKVLRGSMGAYFRLPAVCLDFPQFEDWVEENKMTVLVADSGGVPIHETRANGPVALVLGNEGGGVRPALRTAGTAVAIRLVPGSESLNVAVAAGILLYEVMRER